MSRERLSKLGHDIGLITGAAARDGLTPSDLINALAAGMKAVVHSLGGTDSDVADVFWQLSRHFDERDASAQPPPGCSIDEPAARPGAGA